jgi:predicted nucleic acid-binding protein
MSLVLDASLALSWFFDDEQTEAGLAILEKIIDIGAVVPSLWRLEVANGLQSAIRKGRIDAAYRDNCLNDLAVLKISIDSETDAQAWKATLRLAEAYDLTIYDAAYLELAHRLVLPLASNDQKLQKAAHKLGVRLC